MDETSLSLLDQLRERTDPNAWDRFARIYRPLLVNWVRQYEVQDSDADDLAQDVLIVVSQELPHFQHNQRSGAFRTWLRKILVNRLRDFWRSRRYRPVATGRTDFLAQLDELEDDASRASQIWNREHDELVMQHLLEAVRAQFEPKTWQAFRRQVLDGVRADAVAAELGMSLGSVYVAKSRVLNALRQQSAGLLET